MGPLHLSLHLFSFVAPGLAVAVVVALAARLVFPRHSARQKWAWAVLLNFVAALAVLVAGLVVYGRDGKMATYVAMVVAVATVQWLASRAWKG